MNSYQWFELGFSAGLIVGVGSMLLGMYLVERRNRMQSDKGRRQAAPAQGSQQETCIYYVPPPGRWVEGGRWEWTTVEFPPEGTTKTGSSDATSAPSSSD